jgi:predicted TIM-barrel fold metal-dependent hydrolase
MTPELMISMMDEAGVDRAVVVPPSWAGDDNDYGEDAVGRYPDRFALAGRVPLTTPMTSRAFAEWYRQRDLKAIRLTFSRGPSLEWLHDGTADWFWQAAEDADVPVFVFAPEQSEQLADVASRHPGLRITLDHLNLDTRLSGDEIDRPLRDVLGLAKYRNISVKASSMPSYATDPYPFRSLHPRLRDVVDSFGVERVFWGTDVTRLPVPYAEAVSLFLEELDFLSDRDKELVMGQGVSSWIGWPATGGAASDAGDGAGDKIS